MEVSEDVELNLDDLAEVNIEVNHTVTSNCEFDSRRIHLSAVTK